MATTKSKAELEEMRQTAIRFIRVHDELESLPGREPGMALDQMTDAVRDACYDYIRALSAAEEE